MTDYTKVCWSCGQATMIKVAWWYKCSSCGATHAPPRKLGFNPLIDDPTPEYTASCFKTRKGHKLSKKVGKESAKARAKKEKVV